MPLFSKSSHSKTTEVTGGVMSDDDGPAMCPRSPVSGEGGREGRVLNSARTISHGGGCWLSQSLAQAGNASRPVSVSVWERRLLQARLSRSCCPAPAWDAPASPAPAASRPQRPPAVSRSPAGIHSTDICLELVNKKRSAMASCHVRKNPKFIVEETLLHLLGLLNLG